MRKHEIQSWPSTGLRRLGRRVRELTYSEGFLTVVRRLPFGSGLRRAYQWLVGGADDILRVSLGDSEVLFRVRSPREYRLIEADLLRFEKFFLDELTISLKKGDVFLDVGGALGEFAVPMARIVGPEGLVITLEPEIGAFTALEANVRLNRFTNIRLFKTALSDQRGEAKLWCDGACPTLFRALAGSASDADTLHEGSASGSELVSVEVGDELLEREHLPLPKAVKIDVEGFEYQVIRGLNRTLGDTACQLLCCEIHPPVLPQGITAQVIIDEIKSLGFKKTVVHERASQIQLIATKG
jgi:FkbM family methyltransferase